MREHTERVQAFEAIYTDHADSIFRFACARVSDREEALDIVQDVFSRLWQSMASGTSIDHPRTLLFTIARNRIIDWYRKKKPVSLEGMADPETDEPYEPVSDDAAATIGLAAEGRHLVSAIGRLSRGSRDVVYLRFVEGLSPVEIGQVVGITANAASVRINRGLDELRRLTGYDIENEIQ